MMLGRLFDPRDTGLLLTLVEGPDGTPVAMCQFVPSPAIGGFSLDLMRRDPGEPPNGLLDFALCSTITHLEELGMKGLSSPKWARKGMFLAEFGMVVAIVGTLFHDEDDAAWIRASAASIGQPLTTQ